jgi:hypothetical protein
MHRHLRVPYQQLVMKHQFDKIMDVLLKEQNSETLRLWLEGSIPETIAMKENIGDTALHRIAVVQPPGRFLVFCYACFVSTLCSFHRKMLHILLPTYSILPKSLFLHVCLCFHFVT